jgi:hypothetical protein
MQGTDTMKKVFLLALLLVLILPSTTAAQDDNCDAAELQNWLVERQTWRNASQDVLDAQGMTIQTARTYLYDHLQASEDLDRPACADSAMLWTYYLYSNLQHLLTCAQNSDSACVATVQTRLANYRDRDAEILNELGGTIGFTVEAYADERPEGWTLNIPPTATPPPPPTQAPAAPAQAPPPTRAPVPTSPANPYTCNCSKTCDAMASCEEAYFQLNQCGCSRRDGDGDGVPCENICPGG